jgi:hypothetical protein
MMLAAGHAAVRVVGEPTVLLVIYDVLAAGVGRRSFVEHDGVEVARQVEGPEVRVGQLDLLDAGLEEVPIAAPP